MIIGSLADVSDPWIWTPASIGDLRDQADRFIQGLLTDTETAVNANMVDDASAIAIHNFVLDWDNYRDSIGITGLLTGSTVDRIKNYQAQAVDWQRKLQGNGVQTTAPAPPVTAGAFDGITNGLKWLAIGAAIIGGGIVLSKTIDLFPVRRKAA